MTEGGGVEGGVGVGVGVEGEVGQGGEAEAVPAATLRQYLLSIVYMPQVGKALMSTIIQGLALFTL